MKKILMLVFLFLGTTVMMNAATPATKLTQKEPVALKHKKPHKAHKTHKASKEVVKKMETTKK